jgi:putative Ca2+/H+ antiporter (TMEM165/GDT1 family)
VTAIPTSLAIITFADMGDKTQLLAMPFATRFLRQTVMWRVFAATAANHFFAIGAGNYLTNFVPLVYAKIAAAVSFIVFGLWTPRGDELRNEERRFNFSSFWTVTIAFLVGEMGDRTQLATVALAAEFNSVIPIWLGTTGAMLVADAAGIILGLCTSCRRDLHGSAQENAGQTDQRVCCSDIHCLRHLGIV